MTDLIKRRKNIFIKKSITTTGKFDETINIDFTPDEMIVRSYHAGTPTGGAASIYTMNMQGIDLFSFTQQEHDMPRLVHRLEAPVNGLIHFEVRTINNTVDTTCNALPIIFTLEFIEYHKNI